MQNFKWDKINVHTVYSILFKTVFNHISEYKSVKLLVCINNYNFYKIRGREGTIINNNRFRCIQLGTFSVSFILYNFLPPS